MSFTTHGQHEEIKAAFHGALIAVALPILIFNVQAYRQRREVHHAVNVVTLIWLLGLEGVNFRRHLT